MEDLMTTSTNETTQYIVIKIGDEDFGINISYIENISRMVRITRVPKVAPHIKGVINLRGEVVPVMSLRVKMGLSEDEITNKTRIIILKQEQQGTIGVIVDEVKEVVNLSENQIEKVVGNNSASSNFVQSVGKCDFGLVSLLDLNSVIFEKEEAKA